MFSDYSSYRKPEQQKGIHNFFGIQEGRTSNSLTIRHDLNHSPNTRDLPRIEHYLKERERAFSNVNTIKRLSYLQEMMKSHIERIHTLQDSSIKTLEKQSTLEQLRGEWIGFFNELFHLYYPNHSSVLPLYLLNFVFQQDKADFDDTFLVRIVYKTSIQQFISSFQKVSQALSHNELQTADLIELQNNGESLFHAIKMFQKKPSKSSIEWFQHLFEDEMKQPFIDEEQFSLSNQEHSPSIFNTLYLLCVEKAARYHDTLDQYGSPEILFRHYHELNQLQEQMKTLRKLSSDDSNLKTNFVLALSIKIREDSAYLKPEYQNIDPDTIIFENGDIQQTIKNIKTSYQLSLDVSLEELIHYLEKKAPTASIKQDLGICLYYDTFQKHLQLAQHLRYGEAAPRYLNLILHYWFNATFFNDNRGEKATSNPLIAS